MVATPSTMLPLGTTAPSFTLQDVSEDRLFSLTEPAGEKGLLVSFICNHCPYVIHILNSLTQNCHKWQGYDIKVIFISSNDTLKYPDDSPEKMKRLAEEYEFRFPYLFDKEQSVAKSYRAACTPDFYLFDNQQKLFYRGQYDDSRPGNSIIPSGIDLINAVDLLIQDQPPPAIQKPSLGCNLKWMPGNEPDYFIK
jgi:peroxiredoxin